MRGTDTALAGLALLVLLTASVSGQDRASDILAKVDHLVYATPDLDLGVRTIEGLLGVRAAQGGQHPGLGTRTHWSRSVRTHIWRSSVPTQPSPDWRSHFALASTTSKSHGLSAGSP